MQDDCEEKLQLNFGLHGIQWKVSAGCKQRAKYC